MDDGHLPHVVGQLRHFNMNETFHRALESGSANPTPIRGNGIIVGRAGVFTLSRFNTPEGVWINGRRSETRRQMSMANAAIEPLVQPGLFSAYTPPSDAVAFFVSCFSGSMQIQPEAPVSVHIAVPDRLMRGWLFRERLDKFLERYEAKPIETAQHDLAMPRLKPNVDPQRKDGTRS